MADLFGDERKRKIFRRRFNGNLAGSLPFSGVDALIQALINGSANDGYFDAFESVSGFPDPTTDTLLATTRLATPAAPIGNLVNASDIVLNFTDDEPTILADSSFTIYKYFRITASDHTTVVAWGSIGLSSDDFDPDMVVSSMDWAGGGTLTLTGVVHARSVAETLAGFSVDPSTLTPDPASAYTADVQAVDGSSAAVHRLGIILTPSVTTVSGTGGGSISESSIISNRYGAFPTLHVTSGAFPTTEKVHVTDGTKTGDSANVVIQSVATYARITHAIATTSGSGASTTAKDTTGADLIVLAVNAAGTPSDSQSNTWTPLTRETGTPNLQFFYCHNPTTSAAHTFSVSGSFVSIWMGAYSGSDASAFDVENSANGVAGTAQPGSITPTKINALVLAAIGSGGSANVPTNIDSGFTIVDSSPSDGINNYNLTVAELLETSIAGQDPTWTLTSSSTFSAVIAAFKAA